MKSKLKILEFITLGGLIVSFLINNNLKPCILYLIIVLLSIHGVLINQKQNK